MALHALPPLAHRVWSAALTLILFTSDHPCLHSCTRLLASAYSRPPPSTPGCLVYSHLTIRVFLSCVVWCCSCRVFVCNLFLFLQLHAPTCLCVLSPTPFHGGLRGVFTDGLYTKGTRAHTHRELILFKPDHPCIHNFTLPPASAYSRPPLSTPGCESGTACCTATRSPRAACRSNPNPIHTRPSLYSQLHAPKVVVKWVLFWSCVVWCCSYRLFVCGFARAPV